MYPTTNSMNQMLLKNVKKSPAALKAKKANTDQKINATRHIIPPVLIGAPL